MTWKKFKEEKPKSDKVVLVRQQKYPGRSDDYEKVYFVTSFRCMGELEPRKYSKDYWVVWQDNNWCDVSFTGEGGGEWIDLDEIQ